MFWIDLGAPSYYSILGVTPDADVSAVRAKVRVLAGDLERQRQKARTAEEREGLVEQQKNINRIAFVLSSHERRSGYDRQNAHLTFFQVRKAAAPVWEDRGLILRWLHRTVREFLLGKGEILAPVTDLDRTDFTADFTANELLERLLEQESNQAGRHE